MLRPESIVVTMEQAANSDVVMLIEIKEAWKYVNKKRTDELEGYRNLVVAPNNRYEQISIKTPQAVVTPAQLAAAKDGVIKVRVHGFAGRFYRVGDRDKAEYAFTATAERLEIIE